jgi:hypothetical protein
VVGRTWAWRVPDRAEEVVATRPGPAPEQGRPLQSLVMTAGKPVGRSDLDDARVWHQRALRELPQGESLRLVRLL